jgi:hypothetical protein
MRGRVDDDGIVCSAKDDVNIVECVQRSGTWHRTCVEFRAEGTGPRNTSPQRYRYALQLGVDVALFKTDVERSPTVVTESVPEETWFWAAMGSIGLSLLMKLMGRDHLSLFIGQWAPTFLLLALYRRISK